MSEPDGDRRLFDALLGAIPAIFAYLDKDLVFRVVNDAYLAYYQRPRSDFVGKHVAEALPEQAAARAHLLTQVMETGVPFRQASMAAPRTLPDGSQQPAYWDRVLQPVYDEAGRPLGVISMSFDVTERILMEQALREADRYKDEFLSVISHELRTPLNFITGFASTLQDGVQGPLTDPQAEAVGKIMTGSERMLGLVENLLDLARIQSGRLEVAPEPTPYAPLLAACVDVLRPLAERAGVTLHLDLRGVGAPAIDGPRIEQVLTNLVGNAIKFSPPATTVAVRAFQREEELITEVADQGPGIAEDDVPKLFRRFGQLDSSATRPALGTGLGLAISKALVEAHGGRIGVESPGRGRGSTFWFALPQGGTP